MDLNLQSPQAYRDAVTQEMHTFGDCLNVHDLPGIFHYWSNRYIRPKLLPFGFDSPDSMFALYLERRCREAGGRAVRFVSLGSGNCELEVQLALQLRARGHNAFTIDCLDLNPLMLARGRAAAGQAGVAGQMEFTEFDFNTGTLAPGYDAVIANESLHHVMNLEGLFSQVKKSLNPEGVFIISDMIGRNGHQRWPEALEIVHEFWRGLPPSYRFNIPLNRYEDLMENWDCSVVGFEGIRSQDILPLLLREFHFRLFVPYGNVIDPFVDRSFGHHFDADAEWDRNFIDEVHRRDDAAIASGAITPTHMIAVVDKEGRLSPAFPGHLSPEFCLRPPGGRQREISAGPGRQPEPWPHPVGRELEIACRRLKTSADQIAELNVEIDKRTAWARGMEKELEERTVWALGLDKELEERTAWARRLDRELEQRTAWARRLENELAERTSWACHLEKELRDKSRVVASRDEQLAWRDERLRFYLRHPHRLIARIFARIFQRGGPIR